MSGPMRYDGGGGRVLVFPHGQGGDMTMDKRTEGSPFAVGLDKNDGNLGGSGAVAWLFERRGVVLVDAADPPPAGAADPREAGVADRRKQVPTLVMLLAQRPAPAAAGWQAGDPARHAHDMP